MGRVATLPIQALTPCKIKNYENRTKMYVFLYEFIFDKYHKTQAFRIIFVLMLIFLKVTKLLKVGCLPDAVGKQPSIPLINLGRTWTLNWWWWWWYNDIRGSPASVVNQHYMLVFNLKSTIVSLYNVMNKFKKWAEGKSALAQKWSKSLDLVVFWEKNTRRRLSGKKREI